MTAIADDDLAGALARRRLAVERPLHAPHVVDLEILSALRKWAAAGRIDDTRVEVALQDLGTLRLRRHRHVPYAQRIWDLRHNLTPYDAVYVALAESLAAPLLTADGRLAATPGIRCDVEVIETA